MSYLLICFTGSNKDISLLKKFISLDSIKIIKDKKSYYIKVDDLSENIEFDGVVNIANQIIETINGAAKLYDKNFKGISYNKLSSVNIDGYKKEWVFLPKVNARNFELPVFLNKDTTLKRWITVALHDKSVSKALMLYGVLEHNWKNLYMILDAIIEDVGKQEKLYKKGWATTKEIRLFKHTANSFSILGKDARHGKDETQPPSKPMLMIEAQKLIYKILIAWIESKSPKE